MRSNGKPRFELSGGALCLDFANTWEDRGRPDSERIHEYGDFIEDFVKDRIERVPGVARVNMFGGTERELRVTVLPERMARYGLTVPEVVDAMRRSGLVDKIGEDHLFRNASRAINSIYEKAHKDSAERWCPLKRTGLAALPVAKQARPKNRDE